MSDPIEILRRRARGEVGPDDAMRVLASHDGWYAPVTYAAEAFRTDRFERLCVWGTEARNVPPGRLCLFTSVERGAILQAKGIDPGPCAGPLRGSTLFEKLPDTLASADINPGFGTSGEGWVIARENFSVVLELTDARVNILGPGPKRVLNEEACRIIVESLPIQAQLR